MNTQYKNILIAVDGSKVAEKALERAIQIAKRNDASLVLAHVVDTKTFSTIEPYDSAIYERSQAYAQDMLDTYVKNTDFKNIKTIIKLGSPKAVITKELIPEENIDLVVVGATGLGAVERIVMGSVSGSIVRHAKCDVLVVR